MIESLESILHILSFNPNATAIYDNEELRIAYVNDSMLQIWGQNKTIFGKNFGDVFPAFTEQGFTAILKNVWRTGTTYRADSVPVDVLMDGELKLFYFDFEYQAIIENGQTYAILHTAKEVSERIDAFKRLEEQEHIQKALNEELAATLQELMASSEEITATNEDLLNSKRISDVYFSELQKTNVKLLESEERLHVAVEGAQLGIWDVDLVNAVVNWDLRTRIFFGLTAEDPLVHKEIWMNVHPDDRMRVQQEVAQAKSFQSNGLFNSQFRTVERAGRMSKWLQLKGRVHFSPERVPIRFSGTVLDITEKIIAQQQSDAFNLTIEKRDLEQRMIVEAGGIGTFSYDLQDNIVTTNHLMRKHLNLDERRDVFTDKILKQVLPTSSNGIESTWLAVIRENASFDVEFQLALEGSERLKWLRSIGQKIVDKQTGAIVVYGVVIDVTAQKLEEKRKLDFLGIVSHELKSPLTSLSGYLQILELKSKKLEQEQFSSLVTRANRQSERIKLLIEGFLDVARFGEGKLRLNAEKFDISSLLEQVKQTYLETISSHLLEFQDDFEGSIVADRDKVEQVLINLINNAVKYAPSETTIRISCVQRDAYLRMEVADQGSGIKPSDQEKIFDRFYRVENGDTNLISGFGIGLYICSEIVKLHHGKIGVTSMEGVGTTFWFELPL